MIMKHYGYFFLKKAAIFEVDSDVFKWCQKGLREFSLTSAFNNVCLNAYLANNNYIY